MKVNEFITAVEEIYANYFPTSKANVHYSNHLYPRIWINFYLGGNLQEMGTYVQNDNFSFSLTIEKFENKKEKALTGYTVETEMNEEYVIICHGNRYSLNPSNPHHYSEGKKVPFRKTKGNAKKMLDCIDKYVSNIRTMVEEDVKNGTFHKNHIELAKRKIGLV